MSVDDLKFWAQFAGGMTGGGVALACLRWLGYHILIPIKNAFIRKLEVDSATLAKMAETQDRQAVSQVEHTQALRDLTLTQREIVKTQEEISGRLAGSCKHPGTCPFSSLHNG